MAPPGSIVASGIGPEIAERGSTPESESGPAPLNATDSASATTRYLPVFSEEMAYMTTKNAKSSVIRSA
jgi:hypothetical protein